MLYELYCIWKCSGLITGKKLAENWLGNALELCKTHCIIVFSTVNCKTSAFNCKQFLKSSPRDNFIIYMCFSVNKMCEQQFSLKFLVTRHVFVCLVNMRNKSELIKEKRRVQNTKINFNFFSLYENVPFYHE